MKKLLKALGITIALTAIGVAIRAMSEKKIVINIGNQSSEDVTKKEEYQPYTSPWWKQQHSKMIS